MLAESAFVEASTRLGCQGAYAERLVEQRYEWHTKWITDS